MNNNIVSASILFTPDFKEEVLARRRIRDEAQRALQNSRRVAIDDVISFLRANPDQIITTIDIANATGLSRTTINDYMNGVGWGYGIRKTYVYITRRYAEVDENGALIPGGRTRADNVRMAGWVK